MTAGAQQPISPIAAGDSAVTPPSTLDNGGQPALRKRRRDPGCPTDNNISNPSCPAENPLVPG